MHLTLCQSNIFIFGIMKKLILLLLFISCNNQSNENDEPIPNQQTVEVYLLNTLNDSRGYCIDMMGYKTNAEKNKSLQAHLTINWLLAD